MLAARLLLLLLLILPLVATGEESAVPAPELAHRMLEGQQIGLELASRLPAEVAANDDFGGVRWYALILAGRYDEAQRQCAPDDFTRKMLEAGSWALRTTGAADARRVYEQVHDEAVAKNDGFGPDPDRPRELLEDYSLDSLKMVGTIDTEGCLLYTSPSPRDRSLSRMPSSA